MPTFNVLSKIYGEKKCIIYLRSQIFFLLFRSFINDSKMQITQQRNKSKLKNTYRIKEIIVKGKI